MRKINRKMAAAAIGLLAVAAVGCAAGYHRLAEGKEETAVRETQAVYGLLTVGIQKDGAVVCGNPAADLFAGSERLYGNRHR